MNLFYKKLDWFIEQVSANTPTHVEVNAEPLDSGTNHIVTEYFARFTANYNDKNPITAWKKYGGTLTDKEEMDTALDIDIKRIQELNIAVFKTTRFQDDAS